jgi:hypothetical protein
MNRVALVAGLLALLAPAGCPRVDSVDAQAIVAADAAEETAAPQATLSTGAAESPPDYDALVERIRAGECSGLAARIGTRGPWLVVIEAHIDNYRERYFDPGTHLLVAEYLFDPMSDLEEWTLGYVDCADEEFAQTEFVLCGS